MSKLKISSLVGAAAILLGAMTTSLMAGSLGIGVQGSGMAIEMQGKETLKTTGVVSNKKDHGTGIGVPSGYIQYRFGDNGFVVGIEKIYGSGSLGSKSTTKDDDNDDVDSAANYVTNYVEAELEDHVGLYIETPGFTSAGLFARVGFNQFSVKTNESLGTGSKYGNEDVDAISYGIGVKGTADNGIHLKAALEYTDFDDMQFNSVGSDAVNKVDVTGIEAYGLKISIGYQF